MAEDRKSTRGIYAALPDKKLGELLKAAVLSDEDLDSPHIDAILEELERRGSGGPPMTAEASYREFLEEYEGKESLYSTGAPSSEPRREQSRPRLRSLLRTVAVAALIFVIVFGTMVAVQAAGTDVFGLIIRWTESTFRFSSQAPYPDRLPEAPQHREIPAQLNELRSLLIENNVSTSYLPAYVPEGYETEITQFNETAGFDIYFCMLTDGEHDLMLQYTFYHSGQGTDIDFSKDPGDPELYEKNGTTYYIMTNNGACLATCFVANMEFTVFGAPSREELVRILDSIAP